MPQAKRNMIIPSLLPAQISDGLMSDRDNVLPELVRRYLSSEPEAFAEEILVPLCDAVLYTAHDREPDRVALCYRLLTDTLSVMAILNDTGRTSRNYASFAKAELTGFFKQEDAAPYRVIPVPVGPSWYATLRAKQGVIDQELKTVFRCCKIGSTGTMQFLFAGAVEDPRGMDGHLNAVLAAFYRHRPFVPLGFQTEADKENLMWRIRQVAKGAESRLFRLYQEDHLRDESLDWRKGAPSAIDRGVVLFAPNDFKMLHGLKVEPTALAPLLKMFAFPIAFPPEGRDPLDNAAHKHFYYHLKRLGRTLFGVEEDDEDAPHTALPDRLPPEVCSALKTALLSIPERTAGFVTRDVLPCLPSQLSRNDNVALCMLMNDLEGRYDRYHTGNFRRMFQAFRNSGGENRDVLAIMFSELTCGEYKLEREVFAARLEITAEGMNPLQNRILGDAAAQSLELRLNKASLRVWSVLPCIGKMSPDLPPLDFKSDSALPLSFSRKQLPFVLCALLCSVAANNEPWRMPDPDRAVMELQGLKKTVGQIRQRHMKGVLPVILDYAGALDISESEILKVMEGDLLFYLLAGISPEDVPYFESEAVWKQAAAGGIGVPEGTWVSNHRLYTHYMLTTPAIPDYGRHMRDRFSAFGLCDEGSGTLPLSAAARYTLGMELRPAGFEAATRNKGGVDLSGSGFAVATRSVKTGPKKDDQLSFDFG